MWCVSWCNKRQVWLKLTLLKVGQGKLGRDTEMGDDNSNGLGII